MISGMWEGLARGGWLMGPLLLCSICGLAVILDRLLTYCRQGLSFDRFQQRLEPMLQNKSWSKVQAQLLALHSPFTAVVYSYLEQLDHGHSAAALRDAAKRTASQQIAALERRLHLLSMISHIAPLLGLLGTVTGLVAAFQQVERSGGQAQPADLANGIWEALLTTVFGLSIAIPCLVCLYLFEHHVNSIALQMEWLISYLEEWRPATVEPKPAAEPQIAAELSRKPQLPKKEIPATTTSSLESIESIEDA